MTSESDQIRELKRLLAEAEKKAAAAKAQMEKEKALAAQEKLRADREKQRADHFESLHKDFKHMAILQISCSNDLLAFVAAMTKTIEADPDIPQANRDRFKELSALFAEEMKRIHDLARFVKRSQSRKSEQMPKQSQLRQETQQSAASIQSSDRSIKNNDKQFASSVVAVSEAVKDLARKPESNAAIKAAAAIANAPEPEIPEHAVGKNPGRQAPNNLQPETPKTEQAQVPTICPKCGNGQLDYGETINQFLRRSAELQQAVKTLFSYREGTYRQGWCSKCGHVSIVSLTNQWPVLPGRTLEHELVVTGGLSWAGGIPLHKYQKQITGPGDQLGHDTLYRNVEDWAIHYGSKLLDGIKQSLNAEPVVLADATVMPVGESQGVGVCKDRAEKAVEVTEEELRQKDYILGMSTPDNVEHPAVVFSYMGGRGYTSLNPVMSALKAQILVTDGYQVYTRICAERELQHQSCLVHARRYFIEACRPVLYGTDKSSLQDDDSALAQAVAVAKEQLKADTPEYLMVMVLMGYCKLYGYEKSNIRKPDEPMEDWTRRVKANRQKLSRPIMDQMDIIVQYLSERYCTESIDKYGRKAYERLERTDAASAVAYYMNQKQEFRTFLDDPRVPPDTNLAERGNRAVAVLRRAIGKMQGKAETEALCVWFSLKETARANGIENPEMWLAEYGRALYRYRAEKTLTDEVNNNGRKLDSKLMGFNEDSAEGFDYAPWLPWNYARSKNQETEKSAKSK
jgi:hypothetical protein